MKNLMTQLKNKELPERWKFVDEISRFGAPAIEHLATSLKDEDKWVRYAAADALSRIDNTLSVTHLISALHDEDQDVRFVASSGLGDLKDPKAIPALEQVCSNDNCFVRIAAEEALGKINNK